MVGKTLVKEINMKWEIKLKPKWEVWFAWYPIVVDGTGIWLEKVQRHWYVPEDGCGADGWYKYRNINEV